ncbi:MAG: helix-turn-helix domain-containing protein, partial [Thermaceae bacterium]
MSLTRERILERLRVAPATLKELAQEMGLSRVAVHRHLSSLMARGLAVPQAGSALPGLLGPGPGGAL